MNKVKMPPDSLGLCGSCANSFIRTQAGRTTVFCDEVPGYSDKRVLRLVDECNSYEHKGAVSLNDMYQSAWTLRTEKDGRKIGFEAPKRGYE